ESMYRQSVRIRPLLPFVVVALLVGCAAPAPEKSPGFPSVPPAEEFSIEAMLARVPVIEGDVLLSVGDVVTASDLLGTPRPTAVDDEFVDWMLATSGIRAGGAVSLPWPQSLGLTRVATHDEYVTVAGFGIPDVDAFLWASAPPASFTLLDGRFDIGAISAALGDPDDGIWSRPGEGLAPVLSGSRDLDDLGRPARGAGDADPPVLSPTRRLA